MLLFFAALVRVSCLLMLLPIFGHQSIPGPAKILFCFCLTLILFPLASTRGFIDPTLLETNVGIALVVLREAMVGIAKIFFEALTFAFAFMGMQMGFAMASQYDPSSETTTPVVAQFVLILATLLMLSSDTHHLMIKGLAQSFELIPVGSGTATKALVGFVMQTASSNGTCNFFGKFRFWYCCQSCSTN
jgi:flagellar biosynthetic protein FliR